MAEKVKEHTIGEGSVGQKAKSTFREYAEAILMALLLALFIRTFIVQAFKIPSGSMIPTLAISSRPLAGSITRPPEITTSYVSASAGAASAASAVARNSAVFI